VSPSPSTSFLAQFRERHILPVLTGWFGLCWALLEFSGFLVERYGAPGRLVDGVFVSMWAFLPLVVVLAWWIGAPGEMRWTRSRVLSTLVLAVLGGGLALTVDLRPGPVAPAIAEAPSDAVSEAGTPDTPWVLLFPFRAGATLGPSDQWLAEGLATLAEHDLSYEPRLRAVSALAAIGPSLESQLRLHGARDLASSSLSARLQAAKAFGFGAVVSGTLESTPEGYRLAFELHRIDDQGQAEAVELLGSDPWQLVDTLAAEIRARMTSPDDPRIARDPAYKGVSSESLEALRDYAAGMRAYGIGADSAAARGFFASALEQDPGYVLADYMLQAVRSISGESAEARAGMEALEPRIGVLSDRMRYGIQIWLARVRGQEAQIRQVYAIWAEQWPSDREPRLALARLDLQDDPADEAAWETLRAATVDGGSASEIAALAGSYLQMERLDEADELVELARERDPLDAQTLWLAVDLANARGRQDDAARLIDEIALRRPDLQVVPLYRAQQALRMGEVEPALAQLAGLRRQAAGDPMRLGQVLLIEQEVLTRLGRLAAALALAEQYAAIERARLAPATYVQTVLSRQLGLRVLAEGAEAARTWATSEMQAAGPQMAEYLASQVEMTIARTQRSGASTLAAIERAEAAWRATGALLPPGLFAFERALAVAWQQPDQASVAALESTYLLERQRWAVAGSRESLVERQFLLIDAALAAGALAIAERWLVPLQRARPRSPDTRWRTVRLAELRGDRETIERELPPLLAAWAEADPGFEDARQARALAERIAR
jgi:Tfp pilus assembly protein PilF